jgi:hypothetical protein
MEDWGLASSGPEGCQEGSTDTFSFDGTSCQRVDNLPTVTARRANFLCPKNNLESPLVQLKIAATQTALLSLFLTSLGHVLVAGGCRTSLQRCEARGITVPCQT